MSSAASVVWAATGPAWLGREGAPPPGGDWLGASGPLQRVQCPGTAAGPGEALLSLWRVGFLSRAARGAAADGVFRKLAVQGGEGDGWQCAPTGLGRGWHHAGPRVDPSLCQHVTYELCRADRGSLGLESPPVSPNLLLWWEWLFLNFNLLDAGTTEQGHNHSQPPDQDRHILASLFPALPNSYFRKIKKITILF